MEKIKLRLYQLTLFLSFISLMLALVNSGKQREFFYIAIYIAILGLAFEYKNYAKTILNSTTHTSYWITEFCLVYGL